MIVKYVIVADSSTSQTGIRYLRDRLKMVDDVHFWTEDIKEAMLYRDKKMAEHRLETIKHNNPRILEV